MIHKASENARPALTISAERAAIVALPLAALSLLYAFLTYEATWDIAKVSGALEKPVLSLGIAGTRLHPEDPVSIVMGSPRLGDPNTVMIGSLPFTLGDEGGKTVDTPTLTFRYPKMLKRKGLEPLTVNASGSVHTADVRRSLSSDDSFDYSSYDFKSLDPGIGADIEEPFYEDKTVIDVDTDATTKDGQTLNVRARMVYAVPFRITVSGRDIPAADYALDVVFARATSWTELEQFTAQHVIGPNMKQLRDNLGFWQYLSGLLLKKETRNVYLSFQPIQEQKVSGGSVLLGTGGSGAVKRLTYNLLSWQYLFD